VLDRPERRTYTCTVEDGVGEPTYQALLFQLALDTGVRPIEVGPESTETGGHVYRRLVSQRAVAQIYWTEGRGWWEDLRGHLPIRSDLPRPLLCAVLAEAAVLLLRRPHWSGYLTVGTAPAGVSAEAARVLDRLDAPQECFDHLTRGT
jgi:hypothetical protein